MEILPSLVSLSLSSHYHNKKERHKEMYSVRDDKVKSFKSFKQSDLLSLFDAMGHQVDPKCIPQGCNPQEMKKCVESLSMPPYIKDDICNMLSYIDNNQGIKQYCMKPEKFGGPNKEV